MDLTRTAGVPAIWTVEKDEHGVVVYLEGWGHDDGGMFMLETESTVEATDLLRGLGFGVAAIDQAFAGADVHRLDLVAIFDRNIRMQVAEIQRRRRRARVSKLPKYRQYRNVPRSRPRRNG